MGIALVLFGTFAETAAAQTPSSNEAAAEALFAEGRSLVAAGNVREGCEKLEASQRLDPGTGTLIHLADCYEKLGRTATAWARFREAASRASRDARSDWENIARTRAAELESKLARLRVDAPAGVTVRRDGDEIPAAALGTPLPIDPGEHELTATAPGKKTWTARIVVAPSGNEAVTVPALASDGDRTSSASATSNDGASLRTVGWVASGVGVAGLALGAVTGLMATSLNQSSKDVCPNDGVCADEGARSDNEAARRAATFSTIGFVAGAVLLAGGITLVLVAPSSASSGAARPGPSTALRASATTLWLEGTW